MAPRFTKIIRIVLGLACIGGAAHARAGSGVWTRVGPPGVNAVAFDPTAPGTLYAGTDAGVSRSADGGRTWSDLHEGLTSRVTLIAVDPWTPSTLYAVSSAGSPYENAPTDGIYKSTDFGGHWSRIYVPASGQPFEKVLSLAAAGDGLQAGLRRTRCVFDFCYVSGSVARSSDGGVSWRRDTNVQLGPVTSLVSDPVDPSTLYAATAACCLLSRGPGLVYRSSDAGDAWRITSTGLARTGDEEAFVSYLSLAVSPSNPWITYAGSSNAGVFRTDDGAASWDATGFVPREPVNALAVDSLDASVVYAGTLSGVWHSSDGGEVWTPLPPGMRAVRRLAIDPFDRSVYAVGEGGLFTLTQASTPCASGPAALCLGGGRFEIQVSWSTTDGRSGSAQAVPLTSDSGWFWFFDEANVELVVKVLDGRSVNGHFWVFAGALSSVAYTVTVTDHETGAVRTYENSQGQLASFADTSAF